ncbi:hypothetical protein F4818DRAFT_431190 [Hypoxylon cercidicola]|nr:hypothetical protein F4818DRAFT_431190 [Hypoxylon cercidicola]
MHVRHGTWLACFATFFYYVDTIKKLFAGSLAFTETTLVAISISIRKLTPVKKCCAIFTVYITSGISSGLRLDRPLENELFYISGHFILYQVVLR